MDPEGGCLQQIEWYRGWLLSEHARLNEFEADVFFFYISLTRIPCGIPLKGAENETGGKRSDGGCASYPRTA